MSIFSGLSVHTKEHCDHLVGFCVGKKNVACAKNLGAICFAAFGLNNC